MKRTAHLPLLFFAGVAVAVLAQDAVPAPTPPAVTPPPEAAKTEPAVAPAPPVPFTPLANPKTGEKPSDPEVLELPKMTVRQKPRPRLTPEIMVTRKNFGEDLAKQKFSGLDQALNKFTIPLFGASLAERALEEHEREKKAQLASDVSTISKALEQADPAEAKALKDAAAKP